MPSFSAKPYIVPHDDWFSNSNLFEKKSATKGIKKISNIHDFFIDNQMSKLVDLIII